MGNKEKKMAIKKRAPFFPRNKNGATVPNLPNALNPAFYRQIHLEHARSLTSVSQGGYLPLKEDRENACEEICEFEFKQKRSVLHRILKNGDLIFDIFKTALLICWFLAISAGFYFMFRGDATTKISKSFKNPIVSDETTKFK